MTGAAPILHFAPLESARFGLRVHRAWVEVIDADALAAEIERERVDVAILRLPARAIGTLRGLAKVGLTPIVADTLLRYEADLPALALPPVADDTVRLRPAARGDAELIERMARAIFVDYVSHYSANPLFAPDKILDGYAQWASAHLDADDGSAAWLVESRGDIVGFSCYRIDRAETMATGVLNGVIPDARGRGVYRAMLRAMLTAFADMDIQCFEIATQAHNVAVQRVWIAHGLSPQRADNTVHINALRGTAAATSAASVGIAGDAGIARPSLAAHR